MRLSGTIVRLQVQESSLKVGQKPRVYDPAPIHPVSALRLTPSGVIGLMDYGRSLLDVHHQSHPASKNREGLNGVSIGFASHYVVMRNRFGGHLTDGIAGENMLIELADADRVVREVDLIDGVVIAGQDGRQLALTSIVVAAPCVEFTRFALRFPDDVRPDATVTAGLRFLDAGVRGFYARYESEPAEVHIGDRVSIA